DIAPNAAVTGTLTAPSLGESALLSIHGRPEDGTTTTSLSWRDMLAVYDLAGGELRITGSAALGDAAAPLLPDSLSGVRFALHGADLTWSSKDGFGGGFEATVDAPALDGIPIERPLQISASAAAPAAPLDPADPAPVPADLEVRLAVNVDAG